MSLTVKRSHRTAWHIYLFITADLLPLARNVPRRDPHLAAQFAALNANLRENAPLWNVQGPRLLLIARKAWLLHQGGDATGAQALLRIAARWLFDLSRANTPHRRRQHEGGMASE